ncbi:sulfite reductase subunit C [Kluyvera intermedia]|uniref:sulfite reductase subunit C n=1 Tax=Kluyvera intermedia TaxID=61648 RepID=UPI001F26B103|nr:sulfite reductase subunit C [Kluyvera intermedia]MCE9891184.1 sulfite reductase subunit C [Kluyvera intermedia]
MSMDIDIINARALNEYRLSKVRGEAMISVRVPGGILPAHLLAVAQNIAETWGNGEIHLTTRQKLAMPGIRYEDIDKVNAALEPFIREIEMALCEVKVEDTLAGYQALGGRNIVACQGNRICQKANTDTTGMARRLEKLIYPSRYHLKVVLAGCPNDCAKAYMSDIGIIGVARMRFNADRCIGCGACVKSCSHHAVGCLSLKNGKAAKEPSLCIGCGECVLACPTMAWQREPEQLYQVRLGGRTSKKTPRTGKIFLNWVTEEVIAQVIPNIFEFEKEMLGGKPIYLHMGHLIDKGGYMRFKDVVLNGIKLNPGARVAERMYWVEDEYVAGIHVKPAASSGH